MAPAILVLNAGSSSLKFSVFLVQGAALQPWLKGQAEGLSTAPRFTAKDATGDTVSERQWQEGEPIGHQGAISHLIDFLKSSRGDHRLTAVGHRVVHGGVEFSEPTRLTAEVVQKLEKLVPLAPLHQPHNLGPIRFVLGQMPDLPQVACFDTAFHRAQPELAQAFALPKEITDRGVRRYGFHGLSYEYIASALPAVDARAAAGRVVVAHLGNGASMCAMQAGRASPAPWASLRWTAFRWAPAAERSIPG